MKITEALNLIDQVVEAYRGSRQEHVALQEAMEAIKQTLEPTSTVSSGTITGGEKLVEPKAKPNVSKTK